MTHPQLLPTILQSDVWCAEILQPADVNKLMKQYMQMEKMMGKLAGGGMKGMLRNMKGMLGAMGGGKGGLPFR